MEGISDRAAILQACAVLDQKMEALRQELREMEVTRTGLSKFLEIHGPLEDDEEARKMVLLTVVRRAGTLGAALEKLAENGRGRVNLGRAVDLIWESGVSGSERRGSVRSMAARWVRTHEGWEAEDGDWFAYLPALPPGEVPRPRGIAMDDDAGEGQSTDSANGFGGSEEEESEGLGSLEGL